MTCRPSGVVTITGVPATGLYLVDSGWVLSLPCCTILTLMTMPQNSTAYLGFLVPFLLVVVVVAVAAVAVVAATSRGSSRRRRGCRRSRRRRWRRRRRRRCRRRRRRGRRGRRGRRRRGSCRRSGRRRRRHRRRTNTNTSTKSRMRGGRSSNSSSSCRGGCRRLSPWRWCRYVVLSFLLSLLRLPPSQGWYLPRHQRHHRLFQQAWAYASGTLHLKSGWSDYLRLARRTASLLED